MDRNYISKSITKMFLNEDTSPLTSAIDYCYDWAQKEKIRITDPEAAIRNLYDVESPLAADKTLLKLFLGINGRHIK